MDATRDGSADGGVSGGRRARGLWLGGAAGTANDDELSPETAPSNPRRKITFARLATCVLNVERTRRKTVSFFEGQKRLSRRLV